jgi:hypothetical protein
MKELKAFPEPTTAEVIPNCVARYWDLMALSDRQPAKVIGANGKLRDRPGFEVELLSRNSIPDTPYTLTKHEVLMPMRGIGGCRGRRRDHRAEPRRHRRDSAGAGTQPCTLDDRRSQPLPRHRHRRSGRRDRPPAVRRHKSKTKAKTVPDEVSMTLLATHVGSLPRPQAVVDFLFAREKGRGLRPRRL